jgi:LmbE family N-acetylglucosaminyl deacetylase
MFGFPVDDHNGMLRIGIRITVNGRDCPGPAILVENHGAGGTIALLNRNHNKVYIVVYTNDDKGSYDPDMNSQRLAQIRRREQEASEGMLGTPKENILWMGYDDGMLEYAPQPKLTEEATVIIRRIRPDVLLSVDPGEWYERWHKSDHRMAAFNTIDAVRAAEFWLVEAFRYATGFVQY